MEIKSYIESGILESYVLGSASDAEIRELLQLKRNYPEIEEALNDLETDLEHIAQYMAVTPPPNMFKKIEDSINDLVVAPEFSPEPYVEPQPEPRTHTRERKSQYIEVESESSHMRIHKSWRWVFAAVFLLGKIFLATAIYFYLENRQAKQQIQDLRTEIKQLKR